MLQCLKRRAPVAVNCYDFAVQHDMRTGKSGKGATTCG
jgi:hypothetical protein